MNSNQKPTTDNSRRDFLGRAALSAAALSAVALARPSRAQTTTTPPPATTQTTTAAPTEPAKPTTAASDLEILNFALGLERLEAAYYAQIQGAHQGRAYLSPRGFESARDIGANEILHVTTLENTILAAGGTLAPSATYRFPANVFISPVAYSWFGYTLEEIGIGAYLGAIGQIQSLELRRAAASIYGSEVRHAAVLRSMGGFTFAPRYFESPLMVAQVQTLIAPYVS